VVGRGLKGQVSSVDVVAAEPTADQGEDLIGQVLGLSAASVGRSA